MIYYQVNYTLYMRDLQVDTSQLPNTLGILTNHPFSTFDRENDGSTSLNCAENFKSGWWYAVCLQWQLPLNIFTVNHLTSVGLPNAGMSY